MKISSVFDESFKKYGQVLKNYDFSQLLQVLNESTPKPKDGFTYAASEFKLEALEVAKDLQNRGYGGMPIQIGYCNGTNSTLNCLEYHKNSEINIAADDIILLLASRRDLEDFTLDTNKVEAFLVPAGTGIEIFATTLHYAPCNSEKSQGFRVSVVLPRGTNGPKPVGLLNEGEDKLCMNCNKWLIAHKDAPEVSMGAFIGLKGENLHV